MLRNWKIWQRFAVVAVAFLVPLAVLLVLTWRSQSYQISFAHQELAGTAFERPFKQLFDSLIRHRDIAVLARSGNATAAGERERASVDVDENFKKVEAANQLHGERLATGDEVAALKQLWQKVRFEVDGMSPAEALAAHNRALRAFHHLDITFGNTSKLILDPDVDTYYAMDATTFKLFKLIDEVSQMRALGASALTAGGVDTQTRATLVSLASRADDSLGVLATNLEFGLDANPTFEAAARPALDQASAATRAFLDGAGRAATSEGSAVAAGAYWDGATAAIDALSKLHDVTLGELERMINLRLSSLLAARWQGLGLAGLAIAVATLLLVLAIRSVTKPIQDLRTVAERISLGEMDAKLAVTDHSEIGALADSFRRMQASLATAMEVLRGR